MLLRNPPAVLLLCLFWTGKALPTDFEESSLRSKRQAININTFTQSRWPRDIEGHIPYFIEGDGPGGIDSGTKALIRESIQFWEDHTCVKFKEGAAGSQRIRIYRGKPGTCDSLIAKRLDVNPQEISIGFGCEHFGVITHEVAHSLGFYHEHVRFDRDAYVHVNMSNVRPNSTHNFVIKSASENNNYGLPYDYGSVMHYDGYSQALNPKSLVLTAKYNWYQNTMGQQIRPSFLDILMMNKLYQCDYKCKGYSTVCQNEGFVNPKNCYQCICPWGFGGRNCEQRDPGHNKTIACGANLQAGANWVTLKAALGDDFTVCKPGRHDACHWHIRAPQGKKVYIWIKSVGDRCRPGCDDANIEFKIRADFRNTGYRVCCDQQLPSTALLSDNELAIVSVYSRTRQEFEIAYKYY